MNIPKDIIILKTLKIMYIWGQIENLDHFLTNLR